MSVVASDMLWKFSVSAAAGDTTAGTANTSLGDQISTTQITDNVLDNLFDDVTSAEASAGATDYRCIFIHNNHATDTAFNVKVQLNSQVSLGASVTIASDNIGVTAKGSASAQAAVIATETTTPTGVSAFNTTDLTIGTMTPGQVAAVWIKRVTSASTAALSSDGATLRIAADG
jgi:hypothetical protein